MDVKCDFGWVSWGVLGASWGVLGSSWGRLGACWGRLGASWGRRGAVLRRLGAFLGAFSLVCVAILDGFGWIGWTFNVF